MRRPLSCLRDLRALPVRLLLVLLCACAACDNTVDPFDHAPGPPFAVFGALDAGLDTQFVRVEPVRPSVPFDTTRLTATLRDETAGVEAVMCPQIRTLDDGSAALFYRTTLPVRVGHAYALHVAAEGVGATTARVQVPPVRAASLGDVVRDSTTGQATGIVLVLDGPPLPPARMTLVYTAEVRGDTAAVPVPYLAGRDHAGGGYEYVLQLARDRRAVRSALGGASADALRLVALEVAVRDDGPEWRGEAGQGIDNGFGRFSTISRSVQTISLPAELLVEIGFGP